MGRHVSGEFCCKKHELLVEANDLLMEMFIRMLRLPKDAGGYADLQDHLGFISRMATRLARHFEKMDQVS